MSGERNVELRKRLHAAHKADIEEPSEDIKGDIAQWGKNHHSLHLDCSEIQVMDGKVEGQVTIATSAFEEKKKQVGKKQEPCRGNCRERALRDTGRGL